MYKIFLLLFLTLISFNTYSSDKHEKGDIKKCFNKYIDAVVNNRGVEAVQYLSHNTIVYYDELLEKMKTYDSSQLEQISLMDKLTVLLYRANADSEDLLKIHTGKDLLIYGLNEGLVGKDMAQDAMMTIGTININDNLAEAQFICRGITTSYYLHFYYEDGAWRYDLAHNLKIGKSAFMKVVHDSGMTETEFIFSVIEIAIGKKTPSSIWQPLQ